MSIWQNKTRTLVKATLFLVSLLVPFQAFPSAIQLPFISASDLGNQFAGGAALAKDASTNFANPAGNTLFCRPQMVIAATGIVANVTYSGMMTNPGLGLPVTEFGNASSHPRGVIPAFHYVTPITDKISFGLSMVPPYGLSQAYPKTRLTRYVVYFASIVSQSIVPSLAFQITDKFSLGLGPDAMYVKTKQRNMVRTQPFTSVDSVSMVKDVAGWAYGWHAGLLYQFTPHTRAGVTYHSQYINKLRGNSTFEATELGPDANSFNTKTTLSFPAYTTLSIYHDLNAIWSLMGTVIYMQWNNFKQAHIQNLVALGGTQLNIVSPFRFKNTWELHVGTNYKVNDQWLLRTGAGLVGSAANNAFQDPVFSDNTILNVAFGAHYQCTHTIGVDMGYMHTFEKIASINTTNQLSGNTLIGSSRTVSDVFSAQLNWDFA